MKIRSLVAALCCAALAASCGGGGGNASPQIPPTVPTTNAPNAPAGVSATVGSGTVTLSWQGVSSAQSYNIYYRDTPGVTKQNGTSVDNVQPPETISDLVNGTPYYFVVTAVNAAGEGNPSSEIEATPELQRTKIVSGIHATPGNGEITIEWDSQVDATSYNLYWWTDQPNMKTRIADVASPYVMAGLQNGTAYNFDVTAANSLGEGQRSPATHATPVDPATGWSTQVRISERFFQQSGGQSEGTSITIRDVASNDNGIVAVAASISSGGAGTSVPSVVTFHNASGQWTGPESVEPGVAIAAPSVCVTPAGDIFLAYKRANNSIYARAFRNGIWEDPFRIDSRGFQYYRDSVQLAGDASGNLVATWMEARDLVPNDPDSQVQQVWTNRYDAATDSWGSPTMLVESVRGVSQLSVGMSENNQAIVVWLQDTLAYDPDLLDGGPRQRRVFGSRFDGSEWDVANSLGSSSLDGTRLALDVNATGSALVTSFLEHYDENGVGSARVEANRFDGATEQWDPPVQLDDGWHNFSLPVAHIDDSGHAIAAWGFDMILGAEYDPLTATWGATGPIIADGAAGDVHIDADDSGRSVAFWTTQNQLDGIYTSTSQDGRTTWGPINLLGAHSDDFAVSVNANGRVIVGASSRLSAHDGVYWGTESAIFISTYTPPP